MKKTAKVRQEEENWFAMKLLGNALIKVAESTANKYKSAEIRGLCHTIQILGDDIWAAGANKRDLLCQVVVQREFDDFYPAREDVLNEE